MMFESGLVSVSFRTLPAEKVISAAKSSGLKWIEWGSDVHAPCSDKNRLILIQSLQKNYGISCCSYGTYFRFGENKVADLMPYITAAKLLGTRVLRVWCGTKGFLEYSSSEKSKIYADCIAAAKIAEQQDVILCAECHHHTITDCLDGALELIHTVDSPNFRMYWQPNQSLSVTENIKYAKGISFCTIHIHVFQWDREKRYPLESGQSEWRQYLSAFSGDHKLLLEFMPDDRLESLKKEAETLNKLIGAAL